jgi:hypothetical protein
MKEVLSITGFFVILFFVSCFNVSSEVSDNYKKGKKIEQVMNVDAVTFNYIIYTQRLDFYNDDSITIDNIEKYPLSVVTQKKINDGVWELIYFSKVVFNKIDKAHLKYLASKGMEVVIKVKAINIDKKGKWNGIDIIKTVEVPIDALRKDIKDL